MVMELQQVGAKRKQCLVWEELHLYIYENRGEL